MEQGAHEALMWLGELIAEVIGQILFEGLIKTVFRYPVAALIHLFNRKGRTFDEFLLQTSEYAAGQGVIGMLLTILVLVLIAQCR